MTEPLRTRRLLIRRFTPDDVDAFQAYQADPRVRRYLPGEPLDLAGAAQYVAKQIALDEREVDAWHGYAVEQVESGTVIGDIGVYLVSAVEGDVGFQFDPAFHRQGYGQEAMTAFLAYLLEELGLQRITAGCDQDNEASRALLTRLGLRPQTPPITNGSRHFELPR